MNQCKITIVDEVNCRVQGLDAKVRRLCETELEYFVPGSRYFKSCQFGYWNGKTSLMKVGGQTFTNLLYKIIPIIEENFYDIEIEDLRTKRVFEFDAVDENFLSGYKWPSTHPKYPNQPIKLEDHQVGLINAMLSNQNGVIVAATSSGKTIVTAAVAKIVEQYGRTLTIVPNKDLIQQTRADFKLLGLDVGVFYGEEKELGHKHTISTWQSLDSTKKRNKAGLTQLDLETMIDGVEAIICDECHGVKADVLSKLLGGVFAMIPLRWGLTGTLPKDDYGKYVIQSVLGNQIFEVTAKELQEKGILSNCQITVVQTIDTKKFASYQEETEYLLSDPERLKFLASIVAAASENGNTLILVSRIKTGQLLEKLIPDSIFISGSTKSVERLKHYSEIRTADNKTIIATSGIAAVGINVPRIFNLFLFEPGKSFIRTIQSIGRVLRIAHDKDFANIIDFVSQTKYSVRHLRDRKIFYKEAQYPYEILKVADWK